MCIWQDVGGRRGGAPTDITWLRVILDLRALVSNEPRGVKTGSFIPPNSLLVCCFSSLFLIRFASNFDFWPDSNFSDTLFLTNAGEAAAGGPGCGRVSSCTVGLLGIGSVVAPGI